MSITEISNKCGLPYTTIAELVNGKKTLSKCTAGTVYRIAKELGISVESLLEKENDLMYPNKYTLDKKTSLFLAKKYGSECVLWNEDGKQEYYIPSNKNHIGGNKCFRSYIG